MKLKVIKIYGVETGFDAYIVDFIREAGKTMAIVISKDNSITTIDVGDLEIYFTKAINVK